MPPPGPPVRRSLGTAARAGSTPTQAAAAGRALRDVCQQCARGKALQCECDMPRRRHGCVAGASSSTAGQRREPSSRHSSTYSRCHAAWITSKSHLSRPLNRPRPLTPRSQRGQECRGIGGRPTGCPRFDRSRSWPRHGRNAPRPCAGRQWPGNTDPKTSLHNVPATVCRSQQVTE